LPVRQRRDSAPAGAGLSVAVVPGLLRRPGGLRPGDGPYAGQEVRSPLLARGASQRRALAGGRAHAGLRGAGADAAAGRTLVASPPPGRGPAGLSSPRGGLPARSPGRHLGASPRSARRPGRAAVGVVPRPNVARAGGWGGGCPRAAGTLDGPVAQVPTDGLLLV